MELYDSFNDDSYSTYSKFYSFKEIFLNEKYYKLNSLSSISKTHSFLHETNKFYKKKHYSALRSESLCLKYIYF